MGNTIWKSGIFLYIICMVVGLWPTCFCVRLVVDPVPNIINLNPYYLRTFNCLPLGLSLFLFSNMIWMVQDTIKPYKLTRVYRLRCWTICSLEVTQHSGSVLAELKQSQAASWHCGHSSWHWAKLVYSPTPLGWHT